mgnify:CR=1 FL=1
MKSLKNLLVPAIILVALIIVAIIWVIAKPSDEIEEEITAVDIYTASTVDVASVKLIRPIEGDMTFVSSTDDTGALTWSIFSDDALPTYQYSQSSITAYVAIMTSYLSNSIIHSDVPLSDYGLENPDYTVEITLNDGTVNRIFIGNATYDGSSCYVMLEGDENVYTVTNIKRQYAQQMPIDFLNSQILNIAYEDISTVLFERTTDGFSINAYCEVTETGDPIYQIFDPYQIQASAYFENLMEYVVTLEITSFTDIPEEELVNYGLDNPTFHFNIVLKSGMSYDIYLSNNLAGFFYGYCSSIDHYFVLSDQQIQGLETPALTLLSSYVNYVNARDVNRITVNYNEIGEEFVFEIDTESAISDADASVYLNGRNAKIYTSSNRCYAAVLFEALACITIGGIDLEANPTGDSVMDIEFATNDLQVNTLSFIPRGTDSYYVMMNGEYTMFYVYADELFENGGEDTYSYGVWPAFELVREAIDNNLNGIYDFVVEEA